MGEEKCFRFDGNAAVGNSGAPPGAGNAGAGNAGGGNVGGRPEIIFSYALMSSGFAGASALMFT